MNTKNNQLFQETEKRIIDTVLFLANNNPIDRITVTDVCRRAKINRSSFYAHFQDIPDLLEKLNSHMRKELMESFISTDYKEEYASGRFIKSFLCFIKEHQDYYKLCLLTRADFPIKQGYDDLMNLVVRPICMDHGITSDVQMYYSLTYVQAGFTFVLKNWVDRGCLESVSEIEHYLRVCMHFEH